MSEFIKIAVDAMGGDGSPKKVIDGIIHNNSKNKDNFFKIFGDRNQISQLIKGKLDQKFFEIIHTENSVKSSDSPLEAAKRGKNTSMWRSIESVKNKETDIVISAGNTGALLVIAKLNLKMIENIDKPALSALWPNKKGMSVVLDLGANINSTADHLFQFAVMGSELVAAIENLERPTIGLLNIGEEDNKGIEEVQLANKYLEKSDLNYIGFVEGDDIYLKKNLDIVVADGFVGNISLKTSEGLAKMISTYLRAELNKNLLSKITAILAMPAINALRRRIDPRRYNGASLLGLQGVVVKSHGNADSLSFENALKMAKKEVLADVANRISEKVGIHLESGVSSE